MTQPMPGTAESTAFLKNIRSQQENILSYAMPYDVRQISTVFAPPGDARETERVQACNRLLLYMRGLDIRAQPSLQLAMESMRRAGPDADIGQIMAEMHGLLREHGVDLRVNDEQGRPLRW